MTCLEVVGQYRDLQHHRMRGAYRGSFALGSHSAQPITLGLIALAWRLLHVLTRCGYPNERGTFHAPRRRVILVPLGTDRGTGGGAAAGGEQGGSSGAVGNSAIGAGGSAIGAGGLSGGGTAGGAGGSSGQGGGSASAGSGAAATGVAQTGASSIVRPSTATTPNATAADATLLSDTTTRNATAPNATGPANATTGTVAGRQPPAAAQPQPQGGNVTVVAPGTSVNKTGGCRCGCRYGGVRKRRAYPGTKQRNLVYRFSAGDVSSL